MRIADRVAVFPGKPSVSTVGLTGNRPKHHERRQGMKRREFIKKAGVGTAAAVAATAVNAPFVHASKKTTIKWRLQTYAGAALAQEVIKPSIDAFNKAANGEMHIDLYTADELVPQGELFRAVQKGTVDAVQSDDDSIAAPVDVAIFAAYFPLALRYSLDVPTLFNQYGLNKIWEEAYGESNFTPIELQG